MQNHRPRCCSLLLAVARCCSLLLAVVRCCALFLDVVRCCSRLLAVARCCSLLFALACCCSLLLAVVRCCSLLLAVRLCFYDSLLANALPVPCYNRFLPCLKMRNAVSLSSYKDNFTSRSNAPFHNGTAMASIISPNWRKAYAAATISASGVLWETAVCRFDCAAKQKNVFSPF